MGHRAVGGRAVGHRAMGYRAVGYRALGRPGFAAYVAIYVTVTYWRCWRCCFQGPWRGCHCGMYGRQAMLLMPIVLAGGEQTCAGTAALGLRTYPTAARLAVHRHTCDGFRMSLLGYHVRTAAYVQKQSWMLSVDTVIRATVVLHM
jgi:hypothetical protein